jgi:hypothetical protein
VPCKSKQALHISLITLRTKTLDMLNAYLADVDLLRSWLIPDLGKDFSRANSDRAMVDLVAADVTD